MDAQVSPSALVGSSLPFEKLNDSKNFWNEGLRLTGGEKWSSYQMGDEAASYEKYIFR